MAPSEHLLWLADNVDWFSELDVDVLERDIPKCPGWSLEVLVNHLSFGVAVAYPVAIGAEASTPAELVFADIDVPEVRPTGTDALDTFNGNFTECLRVFHETDPDTPCWTYEGPGIAAFWFRRAAIETTLHRMDAADALNQPIEHLSDERAADAISEALEFALPLAAAKVGSPDGALSVESSCFDAAISVGTGTGHAQLSGEPHGVLDALWGRRSDRVEVSGDRQLSNHWLGLVEAAFAGR